MPRRPRFPLLPLLALLSLPVGAQSAARTPAPQFSLGAGRHDLRDLVDQVATVGRRPIEVDEALFAGRRSSAIVLQRELRLPADDWMDVATTMLFHAGLCVTPAAGDRPPRLIASTDTAPLLESATTRSPYEVLARPSRVEFVRVVLPHGDGLTPVAAMLRAVFRLRGTPWALRILDDDSGAALVGPTDQVALALRLLAAQRGALPPAGPTVTWRSDAPIEWPGGRMPLSEFIAMFCDALDANVLEHQDSAGPELVLGTPTELPPGAWFARATRILRDAGRVVLPVAEPHRIFTLRAAEAPETARAILRAAVVRSADLEPDGAIRPVLVLHSMEHVDLQRAATALRGGLASSPPITMGSLSGDTLYLLGLSDSVAPLVATLRDLDREQPTSERR